MINTILKNISYIFHPLFMPLIGTVFYFSKSPRFIPDEIQWAKLLSVTILTLMLPILIFYLLKTIGKVESLEVKTLKERKLPLIINCVIATLIINRVLPADEFIELHYFFIGILLSSVLCLALIFLKHKSSIHLIGVSGVTMFFIALSLHFNININGSLALMSIIIGAVATSRLHLKAHTYPELMSGFFVGMAPQVFLLPLWL